jgi:hypothetical protein
MAAPDGITITTNEITSPARIEISLGDPARPLAYRVTRDHAGDRYVVRDPFGAAIDGVATLERAIDIATGLARNVREWADDGFDC